MNGEKTIALDFMGTIFREGPFEEVAEKEEISPSDFGDFNEFLEEVSPYIIEALENGELEPQPHNDAVRGLEDLSEDYKSVVFSKAHPEVLGRTLDITDMDELIDCNYSALRLELDKSQPKAYRKFNRIAQGDGYDLVTYVDDSPTQAEAAQKSGVFKNGVYLLNREWTDTDYENIDYTIKNLEEVRNSLDF